ncbi:MAG TPA: hypothetical protein PKU78_02055, partial [Candidatus Dojkabacteria bacterium]|nr:hypothetical protein [Candidatus Dojkabacteria bacterium]
MKISNQKLHELQKEVETKRKFLENELEEGVKRGGPMDSFKEAAAVSANLQAHNQKLKELEDILNDAEALPATAVPRCLFPARRLQGRRPGPEASRGGAG